MAVWARVAHHQWQQLGSLEEARASNWRVGLASWLASFGRRRMPQEFQEIARNSFTAARDVRVKNVTGQRRRRCDIMVAVDRSPVEPGSVVQRCLVGSTGAFQGPGSPGAVTNR